MIGKVLDNRYELVEFIGKGGMALVYRAIDKRTGHNVAVKILRPEFSKDMEFCARFEREAMAASKMSHHNIVNLLDVGQDDSLRYLVMEYVKGQTLKDVILQKGALPPLTAAQIGIRILSALQHAHKNGIIHRDIKPQNILVHSEGLIKVSDFGIARVAGSNTISTDDSVMGSVHYFSPEQAKGENVTAASDLYSVGVVLYEMLTGKPPFDGETPVAVAMQHIGGTPTPISELNPTVPPALERVVEKAMEKRPEKRYQSALEMAQDLQRAMQEPDGTWLERLPDKPQKPAAHTGSTGKQRPVHSKYWIWFRIGIISLIVAIFGGMLAGGAYVIYDQTVNATTAPYCLDYSEEDAKREVYRAGLNVEFTRISDPSKPTGIVIMQSPEFGTAMRKGETVILTISTGAEEKAIPDLVGRSREEAKNELERLGFTMLALPKRILSSTEEWDTVLFQDPKEGVTMPSGSVVQVTLSGGSVTVPNLVGKTREEAEAIIKQLNLKCDQVFEYETNDASKYGLVGTQTVMDDDAVSYSVGDQVMQQTVVKLIVYIPVRSAATPEPTIETETTAEDAAP
ncbi:MAG: protein kinase [Clostridia bacterium]|nr:protein kinase [Clostridia bacterium]